MVCIGVVIPIAVSSNRAIISLDRMKRGKASQRIQETEPWLHYDE